MAQMIIERLDAMAHTLADTLAAVQDESTKVESLIALLAGLKAQLDAALAGALTPEQQAAVDAIFTAATSEAANIDAAITANTPPPAPAPAP
jgi:Spy/CpxP family protein refolding chaperone